MSTQFDAIAVELLAEPDVTTSRMFGSTALSCTGKVFAMEVKGELVVKLEAAEAARLVANGAAHVFDPGHGRPMKQWIAIAADRDATWSKLAAVALAYARTLKRRG